MLTQLENDDEDDDHFMAMDLVNKVQAIIDYLTIGGQRFFVHGSSSRFNLSLPFPAILVFEM